MKDLAIQFIISSAFNKMDFATAKATIAKELQEERAEDQGHAWYINSKKAALASVHTVEDLAKLTESGNMFSGAISIRTRFEKLMGIG